MATLGIDFGVTRWVVEGGEEEERDPCNSSPCWQWLCNLTSLYVVQVHTCKKRNKGEEIWNWQSAICMTHYCLWIHGCRQWGAVFQPTNIIWIVGVASKKWAWPPKFSAVLCAHYLLAPPVLKLVYAPGICFCCEYVWHISVQTQNTQLWCEG